MERLHSLTPRSCIDEDVRVSRDIVPKRVSGNCIPQFGEFLNDASKKDSDRDFGGMAVNSQWGHFIIGS